MKIVERAGCELSCLENEDRRRVGETARDVVEVELSDRFWERKLPLAFSVRHDHALGGCTGVLTLTSRGYSYRYDEHEWFWSFGEVADTDRRGGRCLRIETNDGKSYNFELREALSNDDWTRYQRVRSR